MKAEVFAACVRTQGGIENVARSLDSHMEPGRGAGVLLSLAEALRNPDRASPDAPQTGLLAAEYARNLVLLRDLVDWTQYGGA